jgi:hypothetical protein
MSDEAQPAAVPEIRPDVPTGSAIVRTVSPEQITALVRGEIPPNRRQFACLSCGWGETLEFDEGEMAALGGDPSNYRGPCPGVGGEKGCTLPLGEQCRAMTLQPRDMIADKDFMPVAEQARKMRRQEYKEQAEVLVATVKEELVTAVAEKMSTDGASPQETPAVEALDVSDLKPRPST